ncbi:hypothetical protein [Catenulispora sp. MAP5-51]|uniref:hypothetical protein n=1 Tax=Catenulispora sp. MAP5-51 TaxID=3156298 RepID=UPI0035179054
MVNTAGHRHSDLLIIVCAPGGKHSKPARSRPAETPWPRSPDRSLLHQLWKDQAVNAASSPSGTGQVGGELRRVLEQFDVGVVVRRMEVGFVRLPAYTRFEWPVDRTAVVRWNVDLVLRWILNGIPPDGYLRSELHEFLRARAVAGQPIEDSILVYRRGARMFWEALLDLAADQDRAVLVAEADTVWGCLEDYRFTPEESAIDKGTLRPSDAAFRWRCRGRSRYRRAAAAPCRRASG